MKRATSRLVAGALSLAVVGSATGGVIAARRTTRRRGHRLPSRAASRSRPPRVEATAKRGTVGLVHGQEHHQGHAAGHGHDPPVEPEPLDRPRVAINQRANLSPYVVPARRRSTSSPGSRTVKLNMKRMTSAGSLYGGIQVFAKQKKTKATNGIIPQYEVIGAPAPEPVPASARTCASAPPTSSAGATAAR